MTLLFAFLLMLVIVAAMSVGVVMGRKPIAGSCGGAKALGLGTGCEVCGGNPNRCESAGGATGPEDSLSRIPEARREATALANDAMESDRRGTRTL